MTVLYDLNNVLQNSLGLDRDKVYAHEYLEKHSMLQKVYNDLRNNLEFVERDIIEYRGYPNAQIVFVRSTDSDVSILEIEELAKELGTPLYALLTSDDFSSEQFVKELDIIRPQLLIGCDLDNIEKHQLIGVELTDGTHITTINTFRYIPIPRAKTKKEAFNRSIMAADIRLGISSISKL